jgi:hypothetical protein
MAVDKPGTRRTTDDEEAVIENAWRQSGDLHVIADRLALCRLRNEPPPEWLPKAMLDLADAARSPAELRRYANEAHHLVRYVAVRDAHDLEGFQWDMDKAPARAAEKLRGTPAAAEPETMWKSYKRVRKALRTAGLGDDDPGYRWIDRPANKS